MGPTGTTGERIKGLSEGDDHRSGVEGTHPYGDRVAINVDMGPETLAQRGAAGQGSGRVCGGTGVEPSTSA